MIERMLAAAGMILAGWHSDPERLFAIALGILR